MDEQYATILQNCLARIDAGATIEECLDAFPQQRAAIEGPLRSAVQLRTHNRPAVPRAWLRPAGIVLAAMLVLALSVGAIGIARTFLQAPAPPAQQAVGRPFTLNGAIEQLTATQWVVEQVPVTIDQQTLIDGSPAVGASVAIQGVVLADGTLRANTITIVGEPVPSAMPFTPTNIATPVPTVVSPIAAVPTEAPAQVPPTSAPVEPSPVPPPVVADDPFIALRGLIDVGMTDRRIQPKEGMDLLKNLDEAQAAVDKGDMKKLRDRLRDMQKKILEHVRKGKMEPGFGQQVLDGTAIIANTYNLTLSDNNDDNKGDDKDDDD